ncbi:hypothetical protein LINGRAHAP2_LOCUS2041, partial [Linum grandiflorum]
MGFISFQVSPLLPLIRHTWPTLVCGRAYLDGISAWHTPHPAVLSRLVTSFSLPVTSNKMPHICEPCQLGKSRRLPFPSVHVASSKPFDLVYSDVWDTAPVLSLNGHRYFLLF